MHYRRVLRNGDTTLRATRYDRLDTCSVDGCERLIDARGLCHGHYLRWSRTGDVKADVTLEPKSRKPCVVAGCHNLASGNGMCGTHRSRVRKHGDALPSIPVARMLPGTCEHDGCEASAFARGFCEGHYTEALVHGSFELAAVGMRCGAGLCDRHLYARGLCRPHYRRFMKHGDIQPDVPVGWRTAGQSSISHGYRIVAVPTDLRHLTNGRAREAEHRLVMAVHLGRPLEVDEVVHHINGDRLDNRLENLELWSFMQPKGQRVEDKVAYAVEIIRRYVEPST